MQRRRFLAHLCGVPLVGFAAAVVTGCSDDLNDRGTSRPKDTAAEPDKVQTFGYYQGLGANETRNPGRTDGTTYMMPCVSHADIVAGVEKVYEFWHGHGGRQHKFTVTANDFSKLLRGESVEIYTSVVEDHRHSAMVTPTRRCESKAC